MNEKAEEILQNGKTLTDDEFIQYKRGTGDTKSVRIRTIKYQDHIYYYRTEDDKIVSLEKLI